MPNKYVRRAGEIGVAALLGALLLSGCAVTAQPVPTAQPTMQATSLPAATILPTMAPATTILPTATLLPTLPPAATALPTVIPPTTQPNLPALLGPDWNIVAQGDLLGLGAETVVATRPADPAPGPMQLLPGYDGFTQVVGQLVVVQRNAQGQPWVRLLISPGGAQLNGDDRNPVVIPGGPNSRTFAFALAVDGAGGPFRLVPLGSDGRPVESGFVTTYSAAAGGFAFSPLLSGQPQPATLSGRVGYPSSGNPVLYVFAIDADDQSRFYVEQLAPNQPFWNLRVAPGRYYLVAYTAEPGLATLAGAYSEYVRCGMVVECTDHSLVAVTVGEGQSIGEINIGDWYAPEGSFPARPQGMPQP